MLFHARTMEHYHIEATDGRIGKVDDLYFDDDSWTVRYFVVETGPWLFGKKVLLSPASVTGTDSEGKTVRVSLTREQVKGSPSVDLKEPVSRQEEHRLYRYYRLMPYWEGPDVWATSPYATDLPVAGPDYESDPAQAPGADSHLRSVKEVTDYTVAAMDGEVGNVEDFVVESASWVMRYAVVNIGKWFSGKLVLVSLDWFDEVRWAERSVYVGLTKEAILSAPAYHSENTLNRSYEDRLHDYYNAPKYWE